MSKPKSCVPGVFDRAIGENDVAGSIDLNGRGIDVHGGLTGRHAGAGDMKLCVPEFQILEMQVMRPLFRVVSSALD